MLVPCTKCVHPEGPVLRNRSKKPPVTALARPSPWLYRGDRYGTAVATPWHQGQHRLCGQRLRLEHATHPLPMPSPSQVAFFIFDLAESFCPLRQGRLTMGAGRKLVVVGNGMVGQRLLEAVAQRGLAHSATTVVCEEPRPAYDRVQLSAFFSGKTAADLSLVSADFFESNAIAVHLSERVVAIDRDAK